MARGAAICTSWPPAPAGPACRCCSGSASPPCCWPATTTPSSRWSTPTSCGGCSHAELHVYHGGHLGLLKAQLAPVVDRSSATPPTRPKTRFAEEVAPCPPTPTSTPWSCCSTTRTGRCCTGSGPSWPRRSSRSSTTTGPGPGSPTSSCPAWPSFTSPGSPRRLRLPRQEPAAGRHGRHGAGPHRPLHRHLHGRPRRAGDGLHLPLRLRRAEATLAAGHGPHGAAGGAWAHRTRGRLRRLPRPGHHRPPRRRRLGAGGAQEVDRQRQLRRPDRDLGPTSTTARSRASWSRPERPGSPPRTCRTRSPCGWCRTTITLEDVRVPEANRLQAATSFRDTAEVLR